MAGARITGACVVSTVADNKSSARPAARRASRSAVAGAITTASACSAWRTWFTSGTRSNTSVETGLPLSASRVGTPTNLVAFGVGMAITSSPFFAKRRRSIAALYAAMPPPIPTIMRMVRQRILVEADYSADSSRITSSMAITSSLPAGMYSSSIAPENSAALKSITADRSSGTG